MIVLLATGFLFTSNLHSGERKKFESDTGAVEKKDKARKKSARRESKQRAYVPRATVRVGAPMSLAPFEEGVPLWSSSDRYRWSGTPAGFEDFVFTQFDSHHQGVTDFEIRTSGRVFVAVTSRWGGGGGSGDWSDEVTTESEFLAQGWKKVIRAEESEGDARHDHNWVIYERMCQAGESYRLRTEKYCAPILLF